MNKLFGGLAIFLLVVLILFSIINMNKWSDVDLETGICYNHNAKDIMKANGEIRKEKFLSLNEDEQYALLEWDVRCYLKGKWAANYIATEREKMLPYLIDKIREIKCDLESDECKSLYNITWFIIDKITDVEVYAEKLGCDKALMNIYNRTTSGKDIDNKYIIYTIDKKIQKNCDQNNKTDIQ